MAKNQKRFFEGKHPWSDTKDDLLGCYLTPFFQKTFRYSRNGIVYVDAFAGEGEFNDGTFGSPIIAMQKLLAAANGQQVKRPVQFIFAERQSQSRAKLESIASVTKGTVGYVRPPIVLDSFKEAVAKAKSITVKNGCTPSTYFYYIDPFGIKDLSMKLLLDSPNPEHTEVLVNFNTIGFIRDACAALKATLSMPHDIEIIDDSLGFSLPEGERIDRLSDCIGNKEWIDIVRPKQGGETDFWKVEYQIARLFCKNAAQGFSFVVNMPIKDMSKKAGNGGEIKYRMIHMTNNPDGCCLMNDNMLKRNDQQVIQKGLFKVDIDGKNVSEAAMQKAMKDIVSDLEFRKPVKMGFLAARHICAMGVVARTHDLLSDYLGPLLDSGFIERVEKRTSTGKPKRSFNQKDLVYRVH